MRTSERREWETKSFSKEHLIFETRDEMRWKKKSLCSSNVYFCYVYIFEAHKMKWNISSLRYIKFKDIISLSYHYFTLSLSLTPNYFASFILFSISLTKLLCSRVESWKVLFNESASEVFRSLKDLPWFEKFEIN